MITITAEIHFPLMLSLGATQATGDTGTTVIFPFVVSLYATLKDTVLILYFLLNPLHPR